ncbi:MAG: response regulator [Thermodesulfovibrionales bacterium]
MAIEPKRILVIDDEADIVDVVSAYARELGFEADSARSGGEAVDKARDIDYHAIFCDYRMPGLNGLAIYKLIISKKLAIKGRFIMTTGAPLDKEVEGILRREGIPVLRKPFRLKSIKELIFSVEEG